MKHNLAKKSHFLGKLRYLAARCILFADYVRKLGFGISSSCSTPIHNCACFVLGAGCAIISGEMCEMDDLDDRNSNCGHPVRIRFLHKLHTNSSIVIFQEYYTFLVWSQFTKKTIQWIDQHTKFFVSSETVHKFLQSNFMFVLSFYIFGSIVLSDSSDQNSCGFGHWGGMDTGPGWYRTIRVTRIDAVLVIEEEWAPGSQADLAHFLLCPETRQN